MGPGRSEGSGGGVGSGPVRPNCGSAAAAATRPGSAAKGLFRRLRAAPGRGVRVIACAGRRRSRQAGRGQPCRKGPCAIRGPSWTPCYVRGPLGALPQPPRAPDWASGAGAVSLCRAQRSGCFPCQGRLPAVGGHLQGHSVSHGSSMILSHGFNSSCRRLCCTRQIGLVDLHQGKPSSGATMLHKRPKCPDLGSIHFSSLLLNRKKYPMKGLNSLRMHNGIT